MGDALGGGLPAAGWGREGGTKVRRVGVGMWGLGREAKSLWGDGKRQDHV